jgi:hypothetical protein
VNSCHCQFPLFALFSTRVRITAWAGSLHMEVLGEFDKSIMKYPSIRRVAGGGSTDMIPNLQNPANPLPALDPQKAKKIFPAID